MKNKSVVSNDLEGLKIVDPIEGCELTLSADQQWLRLVVGGKQIASFHVNYVRKVLGSAEKAKASKSETIKPELPANI